MDFVEGYIEIKSISTTPCQHGSSMNESLCLVSRSEWNDINYYATFNEITKVVKFDCGCSNVVDFSYIIKHCGVFIPPDDCDIDYDQVFINEVRRLIGKLTESAPLCSVECEMMTSSGTTLLKKSRFCKNVLSRLNPRKFLKKIKL